MGYVDPDAASAIPENEFVFGGPIFDASEGQLRELQMQEQREREQHWLKKQRPNAVSLALICRRRGVLALRCDSTRRAPQLKTLYSCSW